MSEIQSAKEQFKRTIEAIKKVASEMMKTRAGRDGLRRDLGCTIEGFEDENKEWSSKHPWSNHR